MAGGAAGYFGNFQCNCLKIGQNSYVHQVRKRHVLVASTHCTKQRINRYLFSTNRVLKMKRNLLSCKAILRCLVTSPALRNNVLGYCICSSAGLLGVWLNKSITCYKFYHRRLINLILSNVNDLVAGQQSELFFKKYLFCKTKGNDKIQNLSKEHLQRVGKCVGEEGGQKSQLETRPMLLVCCFCSLSAKLFQGDLKLTDVDILIYYDFSFFSFYLTVKGLGSQWRALLTNLQSPFFLQNH